MPWLSLLLLPRPVSLLDLRHLASLLAALCRCCLRSWSRCDVLLTFQRGGIRGGQRGHAADGALCVDADDESAFLARGFGRRLPARTSLPFSEIAARNLPRCFRCQGIGHVASDCGNQVDTIISIVDAEVVLAQQRRPAATASAGTTRHIRRAIAPSASSRRLPPSTPRHDRALAVGFDDNPVG